MIQIVDKSQRYGCTACVNVCSHNTIEMVPDALGFLYPEVDKAKCIDCGLCNKVCEFRDDYNRYDNFDLPIAYSFRLKDLNQLSRIQSEGAFFTVAKEYWDQGILYGAAFIEAWRVVHQRATDLEGWSIYGCHNMSFS